MLHVTNGDSAAELIRRTGIEGKVLPWRDILHEGPVPAGLPLEKLSEVRARFLATPLTEFRARDDSLRAGLAENEIVLWFEADLYDQLQILQVLDWLSRQEHPRLSVICVGEFPGIPRFIGLGQLTPAQLAGLFPSRQVLGRRHLELARRAWKAFTAPEPSLLNDLCRGDTAALEFLGPALVRLMEEYPLTNTGLGRTEREILRALRSGPMPFATLFPAVQSMEEHPFMGDTTAWDRVRRLAGGARPAVAIDKEQIALTGFGGQCLDGRADFIASNGVDRWIGGVHLTKESTWRWCPRSRRVGEYPIRPQSSSILTDES